MSSVNEELDVAGAGADVVGIGAIATWIPSRRALTINPAALLPMT
jgi:ABC-type lipoprotein release transport system permease subunit